MKDATAVLIPPEPVDIETTAVETPGVAALSRLAIWKDVAKRIAVPHKTILTNN